MKKRIAWLLVMGMCAGLLAGCGGQSDTFLISRLPVYGDKRRQRIWAVR